MQILQKLEGFNGIGYLNTHKICFRSSNYLLFSDFTFETILIMKILKSLTVSFLLASVLSCEFNQSVNKDLSTGAYTRGNGITCSESKIMVNNKLSKSNEFVYGEKVEVVLNHVKGLKRIGGKCYPMLSMYVIQNQHDTVLKKLDLLKSLSEGTDLQSLRLNANFNAVLPYQNNEKYTWYVVVSDKKSDKTLLYKLPFTVKENKVLNIVNKGLKYKSVYLWNNVEKSALFTNDVKSEDLHVLIFEGLQGFKEENGKVFPVFSLELTDANDKVILSSPNLFGNSDSVGVSIEDVKNQVYAKITFPEEKLKNPCALKAVISDIKSENQIEVNATLSIQ